MQFVYYTEKTVAQSLTALNARMQVKGTSSRPALDGWVEKNGNFCLGVTAPVRGRFNRTTYMRGKLERRGSYTVVRARVSRGATRENKIVIYGAMALIAVALVVLGNIWMGLILVPVAAALYIPLTGDYLNSEMLLSELQKTLKARSTPPKAVRAGAATKPAAPARRASPAGGATSRSALPARVGAGRDSSADELSLFPTEES